MDRDQFIELVRQRAGPRAPDGSPSKSTPSRSIWRNYPASTQRGWTRAREPVDEKSFFAAVAERAALSKEEVADLTRATLEELAGQISGGELQQLAVALPDWLEQHLPRHNGRAHPKPWTDFVRNLSQRTGLTEAETERGVRAVMTVLREAMDPRHLEHALSQLPMDYRRPEAA